MERQSPRQRKLSSSTPSRASYYAGARFDTCPTFSILPAPPVRWTMTSPSFRSQSMPSSPITTKMMGMMGNGEGERRLDTSPSKMTTVFKSASFPGDSSLMNLFRVRGEITNAQENPIITPGPTEEEKVDLIQMLIKASPKKETEIKKKKVDTIATPAQWIPRSCQFDHAQEYKDISQHLKSLLKVSA